jgi:hypothetical protein
MAAPLPPLLGQKTSKHLFDALQSGLQAGDGLNLSRAHTFRFLLFLAAGHERAQTSHNRPLCVGRPVLIQTKKGFGMALFFSDAI